MSIVSIRMLLLIKSSFFTLDRLILSLLLSTQDRHLIAKVVHVLFGTLCSLFQPRQNLIGWVMNNAMPIKQNAINVKDSQIGFLIHSSSIYHVQLRVDSTIQIAQLNVSDLRNIIFNKDVK